MKFMKSAVLMTLLFAPAITARAEEKVDFPPVASTQAILDNGLQIVVVPDRRAPVVTHMIWYKAGSADEPEGKSGIAHFLEHLMFKGTKNVKAGEFSQRIAEIGGQENAFTTVDYTGYYQKVAPSALSLMMKYEADRMENLILSDEVIEPEKKVILEERRQRIDSNPGALMGETVDAALFIHHPYGTPIIGWQHEMLKLNKSDAIAFYDKFYSPNNAIVIVAGDVDPSEVIEMARQTYGKVERRVKTIVRERVVEPEPVAARTVEYSDPRVTQPQWSRTFLVPSYQSQDGNESGALDLLSEILGGSTTSRLYRELVVGKEIATSAGAWYQGGAVDLTRFGLYGVPRGDVPLEDVVKAIETVIGEIIEKGVTQEEVDRSRRSIIKNAIFERDSQSSLARFYGTVLSLGGTIEDIENWPDELAKVTVEDVNAVARKYLQKSRSVTAILRPQ